VFLKLLAVNQGQTGLCGPVMLALGATASHPCMGGCTHRTFLASPRDVPANHSGSRAGLFQLETTAVRWQIANSDYWLPHVCPSTGNISAAIEWIFMKCYIRRFFENLSRSFRFL
jgi:hypothetical protein